MGLEVHQDLESRNGHSICGEYNDFHEIKAHTMLAVHFEARLATTLYCIMKQGRKPISYGVIDHHQMCITLNYNTRLKINRIGKSCHPIQI